MTTEYDRVERGYKDALRRLYALLERGEGEGGALHPADVLLADDAFTALKAAKGKLDKAEGERDLRQQIEAMGAGLERQNKAELHPWAKSFRDKVFGGDLGRKQVVPPSGATVVPGLGVLVPPVTDRVISLLQLFPRGVEQAGSNIVEYLVETARIHAATVVAPGEKKPTSTYDIERESGTCKTIAHLATPVKRQDVSDFGLLARYLGMNLTQGLMLAVEDEILNGDGTGEHFTGILNTVGIWNVLFNTSLLQTTRDAVTVLESVPVWPTGWVFSPSDWADIEMMVTSGGGDFIMQVPGQVPGALPPVDRASRKLFGLPVAISVMMPIGQALLGDFAYASFLEHEGVNITWSENVYDSGEGSTDFERNVQRYRCEGRYFFYLSRPAAFAVVDLTLGS